MRFTKEQKSAAYKKLHPDIQSIVMDPEVTELIEKNLLLAGLEDEQQDLGDSEILYTMYGLQTLDQAIDNISKISGRKIPDLTKLKNILDKEIFSKISEINSKNPQKEDQVPRPLTFVQQDNVISDWNNKLFIPSVSSFGSQSEKNEMMKRVKSALRTNDKNILPEFFKQLPQERQDLIFNGGWQNKVGEITKKYSLSQTQVDILNNNLLFVFMGIDKLDDFIKLLTSELGVSRILGDQIVEDLEKRVLDYVIKTLEAKPIFEKPKVSVTPIFQTEPKKPLASQIPEIRPEIVPEKTSAPLITNVVSEKIKESVSVPTKPSVNINLVEEKFLPKPEMPKQENSSSRIFFRPSTTTAEPVQRPVTVPRFTAEPIVEDIPAPAEKPVQRATIVGDIISSKLSTPTVAKIEPAAPPKKEFKYAVDPYREPLE
jgi:signal recognition particle subunit SEC65